MTEADFVSTWLPIGWGSATVALGRYVYPPDGPNFNKWIGRLLVFGGFCAIIWGAEWPASYPP